MSKSLHMSQSDYDALRKNMGKEPDRPTQPKPTPCPQPKPRMTKTEALYERTWLLDLPHKFEGITFKMLNQHRYTPDFYVVRDGRIEVHEVKGSYKYFSEGRARLAFDQARTEYPEFKFVWATKTKEGWDIR